MSTVEERVRAERASQGLPTPAAPIGDDEVDARVAAAYRTTATVLTSASPSDSTAPSRSESDGNGAAGRVPATPEAHGEVASTVGPSSSAASPGRSTPTRRQPAVRAAGRQDNAG